MVFYFFSSCEHISANCLSHITEFQKIWFKKKSLWTKHGVFYEVKFKNPNSYVICLFIILIHNPSNNIFFLSLKRLPPRKRQNPDMFYERLITET